MKKILTVLLAFLILITPLQALATGEGNMEGGGNDLGEGNQLHNWSTRNYGARVTVIRNSDNVPVSTPIDYTNQKPNITIHFNKLSKIHYRNGAKLSPNANDAYTFYNPMKPIPIIVSSSGGNTHIEAIKNYFCSEYVIKRISDNTGINYDILINGDYSLLIEPLVYITFNGINLAMTAHEAGLYNGIVGGKLGHELANVTHLNLPLAIFLEEPALGFPAWKGTTSTYVTNDDITRALGLGVVWFKDPPENPEPAVPETHDYEYRTDTEVITSITVKGGQADPDHPVSVRFSIEGKTYHVSNVYYPKNDGQLVWVKWRTPKTPGNVVIDVNVSGGGTTEKGTLNAKIIELDGNDPPNPVADDRNDSWRSSAVPNKEQVTSTNWSVWRPWWKEYWVWIRRSCNQSCDDDCRERHGYWEDQGWWEFELDRYSASMTASMNIKPDDKVPTFSGNTMKSGYGFNQDLETTVRTNQSSAVTHAQNAVTYSPEFGYDTYWRLLERTGSGSFQFKENPYSTYKQNVHFTPIWFPDGSYVPYTSVIDSWTPAGMLSMNLTDTLSIRGDLWQDWHIAPEHP